jgi:MATE family multidrug resistance protein
MRRSWQCFRGWGPYLGLALPTVGACCLEWWLYEGLILIAGCFPSADAAVAAMGVGFNTTALVYTISNGIGGALSPPLASIACCFACPWLGNSGLEALHWGALAYSQ